VHKSFCVLIKKKFQNVCSYYSSYYFLIERFNLSFYEKQEMCTKPFQIIQQYNCVLVEIPAKHRSQQKENKAAGDIVRMFLPQVFTFFRLFFLRDSLGVW
jgi:hypothetical protein